MAPRGRTGGWAACFGCIIAQDDDEVQHGDVLARHATPRAAVGKSMANNDKVLLGASPSLLQRSRSQAGELGVSVNRKSISMASSAAHQLIHSDVVQQEHLSGLPQLVRALSSARVTAPWLDAALELERSSTCRTRGTSTHNISAPLPEVSPSALPAVSSNKEELTFIGDAYGLGGLMAAPDMGLSGADSSTGAHYVLRTCADSTFTKTHSTYGDETLGSNAGTWNGMCLSPRSIFMASLSNASSNSQQQHGRSSLSSSVATESAIQTFACDQLSLHRREQLGVIVEAGSTALERDSITASGTNSGSGHEHGSNVPVTVEPSHDQRAVEQPLHLKEEEQEEEEEGHVGVRHDLLLLGTSGVGYASPRNMAPTAAFMYERSTSSLPVLPIAAAAQSRLSIGMVPSGGHTHLMNSFARASSTFSDLFGGMTEASGQTHSPRLPSSRHSFSQRRASMHSSSHSAGLSGLFTRITQATTFRRSCDVPSGAQPPFSRMQRQSEHTAPAPSAVQAVAQPVRAVGTYDEAGWSPVTTSAAPPAGHMSVVSLQVPELCVGACAPPPRRPELAAAILRALSAQGHKGLQVHQ